MFVSTTEKGDDMNEPKVQLGLLRGKMDGFLASK
jgi:hypothetical protein